MTLKDAAKFAMVDWRTTKRIDKQILKEKFKDLNNINPTRIGVNEIAHEKGHKYLTIVRDIDNSVIWVGDKRKEGINKFLKEELKLELHKDKSKIISLSRGVDFVGFRNFYYFKLLRKRNIWSILVIVSQIVQNLQWICQDVYDILSMFKNRKFLTFLKEET